MFREAIIKLLGGEAKRAVDYESMWNTGSAVSNASGQHVTPKTAMGITAYFAGIRNISEDVAKLPIKMFKPLANGNLRAVPNHDLLRVLNERPNPIMTPFTFWSTILGHKIGWQGGFAEIIRNGMGDVVELWPLDPTTVTVMWNAKSNSLVYEVRLDTGEKIQLSPDRVFHVRGMGHDGITQYILSDIAKMSLGRTLAAQEFGAAHFGNGATLRGVLEAPPTMTEQGMELLQKSFKDRNEGAVNAYKTPILPDGVKYNVIETDPQKSQLIETNQFGIEDVARLLRIAPNKIQHLLRATYSNIEEDNKNYAIDTLMPQSVPICQEIKLKLLSDKKEDADIICKHDFSELLEGDVEKRTNILVKEFGMGMWTTNELLEKRSMKRIGPDGDQRFIMSGVVPLVQPEPEEDPIPPEEDMGDDSPGVGPQMDGDMEGKEDDALSAGERDALAKMFRSCFHRFLNTQLDKMTRAERNHGKPHSEWWADFAEHHEQYVMASLRSPYEVFLIRDGAEAAKHSTFFAMEMAREYVEKSRNWSREPKDKRLTVSAFADILADRAMLLPKITVAPGSGGNNNHE